LHPSLSPCFVVARQIRRVGQHELPV
jgi:hypothetical protein